LPPTAHISHQHWNDQSRRLAVHCSRKSDRGGKVRCFAWRRRSEKAFERTIEAATRRMVESSQPGCGMV
jgi:hypothetical protein